MRSLAIVAVLVASFLASPLHADDNELPFEGVSPRQATSARRVVELQAPGAYEFEPGTIIRIRLQQRVRSMRPIQGPVEDATVTRVEPLNSEGERIAPSLEMQFRLGEGEVRFEYADISTGETSAFVIKGRKPEAETAKSDEISFLPSPGTYRVKVGETIRIHCEYFEDDAYYPTTPTTLPSKGGKIVRLKDGNGGPEEGRLVRELEFQPLNPGDYFVDVYEAAEKVDGEPAKSRYALQVSPY